MDAFEETLASLRRMTTIPWRRISFKTLSTKDRLRNWSMELDPKLCSSLRKNLCNICSFSVRSFSSCIWESILSKFQVQRKADAWTEIAIAFCKGKSFKSLLFKLALAPVVYHVWIEKNSKNFGGMSKSVAEVLKYINENIRYRVYTWKQILSSIENQIFCDLWNISSRIFGIVLAKVLIGRK
ncbi:uncharacterized protein LOC131327778 [Rhododendron vialii]|uniref:uncharacterized protein LOC131327778 n=1 Tax=Rhododendron vialii TaxID=182163 RepID=UPI00265E9204|nr:uncharacterized protein LOC131327778 [Rhododendron vialii]